MFDKLNVRPDSHQNLLRRDCHPWVLRYQSCLNEESFIRLLKPYFFLHISPFLFKTVSEHVFDKLRLSLVLTGTHRRRDCRAWVWRYQSPRRTRTGPPRTMTGRGGTPNGWTSMSCSSRAGNPQPANMNYKLKSLSFINRKISFFQNWKFTNSCV